MSKRIINSPDAPAPIGPYSQAVLSSGTLYVSGQIPLDPKTGELITGDIRKETRRVMENIRAVLAAAEMEFLNVAKCSVFLKDMNNFAVINEVYSEYFEAFSPARETVEVSRLPKDVNVEISCIAVK